MTGVAPSLLSKGWRTKLFMYQIYIADFFFDFFLIKVHPNDKGIAICLEQQDFNKREKEGEREIQREWENALNYVTE